MYRHTQVGLTIAVLIGNLVLVAVRQEGHHAQPTPVAAASIVSNAGSGRLLRGEDQEVTRYEHRYVLQLRRIAAAKARAARRQWLLAQATVHRHSASAPVYGDYLAWAASAGVVALRNCESGGDYTIHTGNGFSGAYQFTDGTWQSVGGTGEAWQAPKWEQDMRAYRLYRRDGSSPWPVCGRYL